MIEQQHTPEDRLMHIASVGIDSIFPRSGSHGQINFSKLKPCLISEQERLTSEG
jgi:hypothetical protein